MKSHATKAWKHSYARPSRRRLNAIVRATIATSTIGGMALAAGPAFASPSPKVTICHASGSSGWVSIDVNTSSVDELNEHAANGHGSHQGDIIPPFTYQVTAKGAKPGEAREASFAGLNWDAAGQGVFANGCAALETDDSADGEPQQEEDSATEDDEGSGDEGSGDEGSDDEGSDDEGSDDEGSDDEGSDEQGSDEQGSTGDSDEQGSDERGPDDQGSTGDSDEQGPDDQGSNDEGSNDEDSGDQGSDEQGSGDEGSDDQGSTGDPDEQGSNDEGSDDERSGDQGSDEQGSTGDSDDQGSDDQGDEGEPAGLNETVGQSEGGGSLASTDDGDQPADEPADVASSQPAAAVEERETPQRVSVAMPAVSEAPAALVLPVAVAASPSTIAASPQAGTVSVPAEAVVPSAVPAGGGSTQPDFPIWGVAMIVAGALAAAGAGTQLRKNES